MTLNQDILKLIEDNEKELIDLRRQLHQFPEIGGTEEITSNFLKNYTKDFGLILHEFPASYGFALEMDTGRPGKILGLRTDIDGLPILERGKNLKRERTCRSQIEGNMHACGHDGHMAILLTVLKILFELKDSLNGKIFFLFEEGEENGTGMEAMSEFLSTIKFDAIYGNHLTSFMDTGTVSIDPGPVMAGYIGVDFTVFGKEGHISRPDLAINPIFVTAQILSNLSTAWINQIDSTKTVTLGIAQANAGNAVNIIPETVEVKGSMRYFDLNEGRKALKIVKNVSTHIAQAHNARVEFNPKNDILILPVVNDENLAHLAQEGLEDIKPGILLKDRQWFASETFYFYSQYAPSVFAFVGIKNKEYGSGAEHHNHYFDIDEKALKYGVLSMVKFASKFLN